jgi:hypothetical protein
MNVCDDVIIRNSLRLRHSPRCFAASLVIRTIRAAICLWLHELFHMARSGCGIRLADVIMKYYEYFVTAIKYFIVIIIKLPC